MDGNGGFYKTNFLGLLWTICTYAMISVIANSSFSDKLSWLKTEIDVKSELNLSM